MNYIPDLLVLIFCILSINAQPQNILQRCAAFFRNMHRRHQIGYSLNPERTECLHKVEFAPLEIVKYEKQGKMYPLCPHFQSVKFIFPQEEEEENYENPHVLVGVFTANRRSDQIIQIKYELLDDKTVFKVNENQYPNVTEFDFDSLYHGSSSRRSAARKAKLHEETVAAYSRFTKEMTLAMIYLDGSDFKYAIFQTLDQECAWVGWRRGVDFSRGLTDDMRRFFTANNISQYAYKNPSSWPSYN